MTSYPRLQAIVAAVRQKTSFVPHTALVLGSGLGGFGEKISLEAAVPYAELPGFPISTVPGHQGRFLFGYVEEEPVVVMLFHGRGGAAPAGDGRLGGPAAGAHQRGGRH